mgnify:CR=1 FL=1
MPNIKQAKKRVLQTEKRTRSNKAIRSRLRTTIRKAETAVEASAEDSKELLLEAIRRLDKAASQGYVSKNMASRKKSQLMKKLNTLN